MYLFRSPGHRQCKAALRTFDEFKEMLQTLVNVYEQLTNQMSPAQAERLRGACAEGAPGQTPLAPFEGRRAQRLACAWQHIHGCKQAGRSAMGVLGGLQTATPAAPEAGFFPALWRVPEEMLLDPEVLYAVHDVMCEYSESVGMLSLPSGTFSGTGESISEARRIFDILGIDQVQASDVPSPQSWCLPHWWRGPEVEESRSVTWTDPWSIAVGGLVGVLFGLLEHLHGNSNEQQSLHNTTNMHILEKMARRGFIGLAVSAAFHFLGRLLRQCLPGRCAAFSRKSVPASQAVVFLGTAAWALTSRHKYVAPGLWRRLWLQDLNLAERQAAGIILTSGIACSFSFGGYVLGARVLGGSFGGPAGAFAGSLMPIVVSVALAGLDWWHDRRRRRQMKAAALQTLGLPEPGELGIEIFRPMLSTRYKLLARYLHPDKNDSSRCDTTKVFSQIRLAKEILEQELKDYHGCPRGRLRRLFEQMCALCGCRRDRYVSEHPSGLIMNILEDGIAAAEDSSSSFCLGPVSDELNAMPSPSRPLAGHRRSRSASSGRRRLRSRSVESSRSEIDSITTVESRSLSASRAPSTPMSRQNTCNSVEASPAELRMAADQQFRPNRPRTPRKSRSPHPKADNKATSQTDLGNMGSGDGSAPWVFVNRRGDPASDAGASSKASAPSTSSLGH